MANPPIQRPVKTSGTRTFVEERIAGFPIIEAAEVDAELNNLVNVLNAGLLPVMPALEDLSVTTAKLADAPNGVTTVKLNDGAVTDVKIASVSWAKVTGAPTSFAPTGGAGGDLIGTYPNPFIRNEAVTRAHIEDGAINHDKLAPGAVNFPAIGNGEVGRIKLSADVWPTPIPTGTDVGKVLTVNAGPVLAWAVVPPPPIPDGSITDAKIASVSYTKVTGAPTQLPPTANSVYTTALQDLSVTAPKLADEAVLLRSIDLDSVPLPPVPTHGNLGQILGVIEAGLPTKPTIAWVDPATYLPGGGGGGGTDGLWSEDLGTQMVKPVSAQTGVALDAGSDGLVFHHSNYPTIDRRTGIDADDVTLQVHGGSSSIQFKNHLSTAIWASLSATGFDLPINQNALKIGGAAGLARGRFHILPLSPAMLEVSHNIDGVTSAPDNVAWPAWRLLLNGLGDNFRVTRNAPAQTGNGSTLLVLDNVGQLSAASLLATSTTGITAIAGTVTVARDPTVPLEVATKQYCDANAGGGGGGLWLADNFVLKPTDPLVWAVQLPPSGQFLGGASPSDCGSLKLDSTEITLLCTANGSTFDVILDGGTHILAADSTRCTVNGFLFADGIELDTTIRLGPTGPAPSDGTLQYTGTKFQGRVGGVWVDIPGAGGGGGAVGPDRTVRTLAGGTTVLDGTAQVHFASAISNATLPLASSCPGRIYEFAPANQINLSRSGSDTIVVGTAAGVTSLPITASMRVTLISDGISAWRVIAADPALSITGINAGGSLNGTYPNPGLAANSVNATQIAAGQVQPTKMAGTAPAAGDAGKLVVLDHTNPTTQWKIVPATIDAAGLLTLPFLDPAITFGGASLGRVSISGVSGQLSLIANNPFVPVDTTQNGWLLALREVQDDLVIFHKAGGAGLPVRTPFSLAGNGSLSLASDAAGTPPLLALRTMTSSVRFRIGSITGGNFQFYSNASMDNLKDDPALPSLAWVYDAPAREFGFYGAPAGASITWSQMMALNVDGAILPTAGEAYSVGSLTAKTRLTAHPTLAMGGLAVNAKQSAAGVWTQDDAARPSWRLELDTQSNDRLQVVRFPAGSTTAAFPLLLNATGELRTQHSQATVSRFVATAHTNQTVYLTNNLAVSDNSLGDAAQPTWGMSFGGASPNDVWAVRRAPAGSTTLATLLALDQYGQMALNPSQGLALTYSNPGAVKGRLLCWGASDIWFTANRAGGVRDDTARSAWVVSLGTSTNNTDQFSLARDSTTGATTYPFVIGADGNLFITGATGQKASGTTWANPSDRRIKDEIADYPTGLDIVTQLQPRTFVYNGKGGSTAGMRGYGFIADEVQAVMPEMVGTTRAKLAADDEELTDIQTVDQSNLILALVNSVQELAARVAALEAA